MSFIAQLATATLGGNFTLFCVAAVIPPFCYYAHQGIFDLIRYCGYEFITPQELAQRRQNEALGRMIRVNHNGLPPLYGVSRTFQPQIAHHQFGYRPTPYSNSLSPWTLSKPDSECKRTPAIWSPISFKQAMQELPQRQSYRPTKSESEISPKNRKRL